MKIVISIKLHENKYPVRKFNNNCLECYVILIIFTMKCENAIQKIK